MARVLILTSQAKSTSTAFLSSFSTCSVPLFSCRHSFRTRRTLARFFCRCARQELHPAPVMTAYKEAFSKRMALAGLKPHHRIALGVSGGPDSMALCVLAADWKINGFDSAGNEGGFIDGLLAIIVDHGLRAESEEEANIVRERVSEMGIRCEVACCEWKDGRPEQGNLQEAAREMRYRMFHKVCIDQQFGVLLLAHHADDQAELLVIRLSRNSSVLGLAGMAFTSQLFATKHAYSHGLDPMHGGILLVRPFLHFSKKDMYKICQESERKWVEDPSNKNPLFVRNRIRMSLQKFSSSVFSSEVQSLISACQRTRAYVDKICSNLLHEAVTIMDEGYAVIHLYTLNPSKVEDVCLVKFIATVTQYISQRRRPNRGNASKLLLSYFRTFPCKTSLTAAGCYLCPAPGSRGTKIVVCCSVDCPLPSKLELFHSGSSAEEKCVIPYDLKEIMDNANTSLNLSSANASDVHFLNVTSGSVLDEAKRLNLISESTCRSVLMLQEEERNRFIFKSDVTPDYKPKHAKESVGTSHNQCLRPGQMGLFMNRFFISWKPCKEDVCREFTKEETSSNGNLVVESLDNNCRFCSLGRDMVAEIRHMMESDWLYLAKLSRSKKVKESDPDNAVSSNVTEQAAEKASSCLDYARVSAQRAIQLLKPIPAAARRSLPVFVDSHGLLLSIPSISFKHCPYLDIEAKFQPRVPLGGGHTSFI